MNKKLIALLCNIKSDHKFIEADYDELNTVNNMKNTIQRLGFNCLIIQADNNLFNNLLKIKNKIYLAFNYSVGVEGVFRYAYAPFILNSLKIPYVGSDPITQFKTSNKFISKKIMKMNGIDVVDGFLYQGEEDYIVKNISHPSFVKLASYGSSAGITNKNIVHNKKELFEVANNMYKKYNQAVLIEKFLKGREFSVSMIGNPAKVFPIVELKHEVLGSKYGHIASIKVKNFITDNNLSDFLECPADIDKILENKIIKLCKNVWKIFNIKDWCRIDIRCDEQNNPFVLDINQPASLEPYNTTEGYCSFTFAAKKSGLNFDEIIDLLLRSAIKRLSL